MLPAHLAFHSYFSVSFSVNFYSGVLMRRLFLLLLPLFSVIVYAQAIDPAAKAGYESINAANLKANLTVLASDS